MLINRSLPDVSRCPFRSRAHKDCAGGRRTPQMHAPAVMRSIPAHWWARRARPRSGILRRPAGAGAEGEMGGCTCLPCCLCVLSEACVFFCAPANRTTVPRSIWKTEADVRMRPTLSIVVAQASHAACQARGCGVQWLLGIGKEHDVCSRTGAAVSSPTRVVSTRQRLRRARAGSPNTASLRSFCLFVVCCAEESPPDAAPDSAAVAAASDSGSAS